MRQATTIEEFGDLRARIRAAADDRGARRRLVISAGTCGQASGANDVMRIVKRRIVEDHLQDQITLRVTGCQGFCQVEPFILVEPGNHLYANVRMEDVGPIIDATLEGRLIDELLYRERPDLPAIESQDDIPFFKGQQRTVLGANQHIDPIRILDYIEEDGYAAAEKVLSAPDPEAIIAEVKRAGLRGRGGAGFPTGLKWEFARNSKSVSGDKYVICNADEGDPGAYMDRSLLEGNPHSIIEGMLIAGVAIGANHGVIYVRAEYPLAIKHALIALGQARELGILGDDVFGTGIDFDIEIIRGAGAFVCGEETALIKSIEGKVGEPVQRPPYPVERGVWGDPTCINNVETLANVPIIIRHGAAEYRKVGIDGNHGTKIFSLVGKIRNTGLVEVPLGTKISEVVYEIGGGALLNRTIKAVQTGGPSGGCIPAREFNLPIDFDSLVEAGTIMGSGGMIVMDDTTCMVDVAKYFMAFLKDESCGKCYPCRKGTQRMHEILEDISEGRGTVGQLDLLEELARVVADSSMCGLGQSAANPVLSTIRYFREEYLQHIEKKRCPAGVCKDLVGAPCQSTCPVGTEAWRYVALIEKGDYDGAYRAIREPNPFPSVCARVCNHPCESRCRAGLEGVDPVQIRQLKRFVTDRVEPSSYKPTGVEVLPDAPRIAIIGAGPAGLTAAHMLSLKGYRCTIFEKDDRAGGMLVSAIPPFRLPREIVEQEIDELLDENIELKLNTAFGGDVTFESLEADGYAAIFYAVGAHESWRLELLNEDLPGVYSAMDFLKGFCLEGKQLAKGKVGVIGGGNTAIDAARVALRQEGVEEVQLFYRRTRQEMPAFEEEIEGALEEGIRIETLVTPRAIRGKNRGKLTAIEVVKNVLGDVDSSGRRRPVEVAGSGRTVPLDTLIVAISEQPETKAAEAEGLDVSKWGLVRADPETLETNLPMVFAGGDVVTGPNTVIDAIAAGKRVATMIDRKLGGEELRRPPTVTLPEVYVSATVHEEELAEPAESERTPLEERLRGFAEVETGPTVEHAVYQASRCLRCDLDFTRPTAAGD